MERSPFASTARLLPSGFFNLIFSPPNQRIAFAASNIFTNVWFYDPEKGVGFKMNIPSAISALLRRFQADRSGQIAILFAFSSFLVVASMGGGIDLARAYMARQKLSQVATLACQYASRPSIVQASSSTYSTNVTNYITSALQTQHFTWTQTTSQPFVVGASGQGNVTLSASVPTAFMQIVNISQLSVQATAHCYDSKPTSSSYALQESFETSNCSGTCYTFYQQSATSKSTLTSSPGYTGASGTQWYIYGYGLEIDSAGIIKSSVPNGTHSAELDSDNGSGSAGNSSVSTKKYLNVGNYELRWNYTSRVSYPDYDPVYICGSAASDLSWANNTNSSGGPVSLASRTNQINVYLDINTNGSPPTHKTIDNTQTLAGSNLIDMCVYSTNWIERSVRIYVTTAGYYWLSFAADGQNDSYGGQIDNIRLCTETCPTSLQDNFPSSWLTSSILFEDKFESPTYTANSGSYRSTSGNMNNSTGTSGSSSSGWPSLASSGWATAPYNQMDYILKSPAQGVQSIELDATASGSMTTSSRLISRSFLLVPGYYNVSYYYIAGAQFSSLSSVYCGATPTAANISSLSGQASATLRTGGSATAYLDTNIVGVFMSHALEASTPIGSGSLNSTTKYTNPDGTTSTTPTVAPDGISLTSYNSSQVNPLLDICGYAASWQTRSANFFISKTAYYWLTFSAKGTADSYGGTIDDVKLTALGSPFMTSPPSSYVTIPVPDPQPSATVSYTGFYIIADPVAPPAPLQ
jgi:Flp pilus assembly protein TadG